MLSVVISVGVLLSGLPLQQVPLQRVPPINFPIILRPDEAERYDGALEMAFLAGACERFYPGVESRMEDGLGPLAQHGSREAFMTAGIRDSFQRGRTDPDRHERTLEGCQAEIAQAEAKVRAIQAP